MIADDSNGPPTGRALRRAICPSANTVVVGRVRVQFLTERLVRLEWQENGAFEDRPTLAVVNRDLGRVRFTHEKKKDRHLLKTRQLAIELRDGESKLGAESLHISFAMNGKRRSWRPGQSSTGNLGGTVRTLDHMDGNRRLMRKDVPGLPQRKEIFQLAPVDLGQGFLSRDGWSLIDDSRNIVLDQRDGRPWVAPRPAGDRQDWYFLGYGHDYRAALADAAKVFGAQPLPPRYTLGYWWSRFWAYSDTELEELVRTFDRHDLPLDVVVIDMDWHREGWTGYSWDRRYFPDPDEHLRWLHRQGLKISLNLHPADGIGRHEDQFGAMCRAMGLDPAKTERVPFDITDPRYMANYFKILHHPEERRGVDFWWMDWQQGASTAMPGLDTLPWINQRHWEDLDGRPDRHGKRPLIFSRFGGYGSGRYNIGFSGDTFSSWESLAFLPRFTATAANILYGYWSHDIGGHFPRTPDPELYTRWIQYGLYSPVLRTHATKHPDTERRVWEYPAPYREVMAAALRHRYALVPYIYSENRKAFDTGVSLCRPMYYDWPEAGEAYRYRDQYLFGDAMLVAPVVTPRNPANELAEVSVWLPAGEWFDTARGCTERGGRVITRKYLLSETPVFVRPGAIIPGQQPVRRLNDACYRNLLLTIHPGDRGTYDLYEDDGISTDYRKGKFAIVSLAHRTEADTKLIRIAKARGRFHGYQPQRSLEVRLETSIPPAAVTIGKRQLRYVYRLDEAGEGWSYQGRTATAVIKLRTINLDRGVEIKVRYPPRADHCLAKGLRSQFARLARVNEINTTLTLWMSLHPEERLSQDLYQTANRISRQPETFATEIRRFRQLLPRLPEVISSLANSKLDSWFDDGMSRRLKLGNLAINLLKEVTGGPAPARELNG